MFAGAPGVRGLVGVARVLRLVVHVSAAGRRADLSGPSPSTTGSAQLALALSDGLGGECQGQLEQVNFAP